ncbi:MAG: Crp/Fnr family transcriptional regulator [Burkholderiaceae bacterium]
MTSLTQVNRAPGTDSRLQRLLETAAGCPLPEWDRVVSELETIRIAAGATVFEQGVVHPYLYAVRQGLVKLCYLDEDGNEWIKSFSEEGRFFASIAALQPAGRTSFLVEAMEPTELERLAYPTLSALASQHLAWARAAQNMTMAFAARKEARERDLLTLTPEGRYRAFLADNPGLAQRIPRKTSPAIGRDRSASTASLVDCAANQAQHRISRP